jgi:cyanophycinase
MEPIMRTRFLSLLTAVLLVAAGFAGRAQVQPPQTQKPPIQKPQTQPPQTQKPAPATPAPQAARTPQAPPKPPARTLPASPGPVEYGPAKGTLIIVGGGNTDGTGIVEKFIELAGGLDAKFIIVPTAGGNKNPDGTLHEYKEEQVIAPWLKRGLKNVHMLHTADPKVADTEVFVKDLREANGVWFDGGRQWNIVDSFANTLTLKEFHKVLERGGVIAGSSAGATIQGDYLVRGDTSGADVMMTAEPNHQHGFAFLRKSAIDQHQNTRQRWDDLNEVIEKMPDLLGIGLSEGTAIIVTGDTFEVMGKWKVAIHDNQRLYQPWEKPYYVLSAGDVYDMKARRIIKLGIGATPPRRPTTTTTPTDGVIK